MIENFFWDLIGAATIAVLGYCARLLKENRRRLALLGTSITKQKKRIRISAAYLFRIKIDERYLLILGGNIDQYQPVGGVYKFFPSAKIIREELGIKRDTKFAEGPKAKDDIRITLPGKNLLNFMNWFDARIGREVDTWREFHEELVASGCLSVQNAIDTFEPEFIKRAPTKVQYKSQMGMDELLVFDIYEVILNEAAEREIRAAMNGDDERRFILVEETDITRECVSVDGVSKNIAGSAKWVISDGR